MLHRSDKVRDAMMVIEALHLSAAEKLDVASKMGKDVLDLIEPLDNPMMCVVNGYIRVAYEAFYDASTFIGEWLGDDLPKPSDITPEYWSDPVGKALVAARTLRDVMKGTPLPRRSEVATLFKNLDKAISKGDDGPSHPSEYKKMGGHEQVLGPARELMVAMRGKIYEAVILRALLTLEKALTAVDLIADRIVSREDPSKAILNVLYAIKTFRNCLWAIRADLTPSIKRHFPALDRLIKKCGDSPFMESDEASDLLLISRVVRNQTRGLHLRLKNTPQYRTDVEGFWTALDQALATVERVKLAEANSKKAPF